MTARDRLVYAWASRHYDDLRQTWLSYHDYYVAEYIKQARRDR